MIRQRTPLPRSTRPIRKRRKAKKSSLRYEVINGQYRKYPDGRLVAQNTPKGDLWYWEQTILMAHRQEWICGICHSPVRMHFWTREGATFSTAMGAEWEERGGTTISMPQETVRPTGTAIPNLEANDLQRRLNETE